MLKGQLFEYTCQPNGFECAPRLFTKLMKPIFGQLRAEGLLSIIYIEDSYMQGNSYRDCLHNVQCTRDLISQLGFSINENKSVFEPTQMLTFLGFILDSITMCIYLTELKRTKLKIQEALVMQHMGITIRKIAELIFAASLFSLDLFISRIISCFKRYKGNFDQ
jgi:hypothetical protein